MITIDSKLVLLNLRNEPLKQSDGTELTVGGVVSNMLSGKVESAQRGFQLAKKFALDDVVELKAEDVVFIKTHIEKESKKEDGWNAIVTGQLLEIMDGVPQPTPVRINPKKDK